MNNTHTRLRPGNWFVSEHNTVILTKKVRSGIAVFCKVYFEQERDVGIIYTLILQGDY
jgi:hypothetical protein